MDQQGRDDDDSKKRDTYISSAYRLYSAFKIPGHGVTSQIFDSNLAVSILHRDIAFWTETKNPFSR